jgi:hypothetical protein
LTALARVFPERWKPAVAELRHRMHWRRLPLAQPTARFARRHGLAVRHGPFAGMVYPSSTIGLVEQLVPKLLGSYECELHPQLERLMAGRYEQVVDIGAADGYYAVGLARAIPDCTVQAFEMNPLPARVCRGLAAENGAGDRVTMRGECGLDDLRALKDVPTLVFCDCEGGEAELLDPSAVPLLRTATVIVELHESLAPGVERELPARFAPTHSVEVIGQQLRHSGDYPELADGMQLNFVDQELLVSEFRPHPVTWAVMVPKDAP